VNRQIRRLGIALLALYFVLFVQLNWLQIVKADDYNKNPSNNREVVRDFTRDRGVIVSADGAVVAESVDSDDRFRRQRVYPQGPLMAQITGYFSFSYGTEGVERVYNDELAGQTDAQKLSGLADLFDDQANVGDVQLTVRTDVQAAAQAGLADRRGSVVALDPRTGAILAMYSNPSYDPNLLANHDLEAVRQVREVMIADPANPLLTRAYQERYFPGSTYKIVTASAGLESGLVTTENPSYPVTDSYTPPLTTRPIRNFNGGTCGGRLIEVIQRSCNTAFAQMGVDLGPQIMVERAEAFGFNDAPPIDLPRPAESFYPPVEAFNQDTPKLAQTAFGQNDVQATPLQMAMVAAAVANDGVIMTPHVMSQINDRSGGMLDRYEPTVWKTPLSPQNAAILQEGMVAVVNGGTGTNAAIDGVQVAAKTGTAQLGTDPPTVHNWMIAYAPADNPRVAVAVLVERQPEEDDFTGGVIAAPIARQIIEAVLAAPDPVPAAPSG